MAKSTKVKDIDITKSGPMTYSQLQDANNDPFANVRPGTLSLFNINSHATQGVRSSFYGTATPWGESSYDNPSATEEQFQNLGDIRANNQPWYDAGANALVKMLGTAATTLISSIGGLIYGPATAISEGRWSGLWDNELTQAMSDVDNYLEDNFKIYQTKNQENAPWLSWTNLTSAGFWGDDVIKNAGFMLGASASGSLFTGGLGLVSKALGLVNSATKATKTVTAIAGSLFSAAGEGAIEAKQTMESLVQLNNQRLDDELSKLAEAYAAEYENTKGNLVRSSDGSYYDPAFEKYKARMNDLAVKREAGRAQILQDARRAGNIDMALNIPILTWSNFITLGKGFSKSFANASKLAEATNKAEGASFIRGANRNNFSKAFKAAQTGASIEGVESTLKGNNGWRKAWAVTKPILSEGSEEMNQQWASSLSGYLYDRKDPNDYWRAKLDPGSEQETMSALTAIGKGFYDSWGSYDQWEQFFVGGLMGGTGMPMPTKTFSQDKTKKKYDPRRYFSWEGGSFQNLKDLNNKLDEATKANEALNKRYKDPNFWNRMRSAVAHSYFQEDMDKAVANEDIKSYKDAEEKQFVQDLETFVKAGRVDDFRALIGAATEDLTDEDIDALIDRNTTIISKEQDAENKRASLDKDLEYWKNKLKEAGDDQELIQKYTDEILKNRSDYANVVGEEQKIGLYVDTYGNRTKSNDEIRQELKSNGEKLNQRVDNYLKSIDLVNRMSGGKLTEDQIGNLAYLHYMSNAAMNRANSILNKLPIFDKISIKETNKERRKNLLELMPNIASEDIESGDIILSLNTLNEEEKKNVFLNFGLGYNTETASALAERYYENSNGNPNVMNDLYDMTRLVLDAREFNRTFNDYMSKPNKVDEDKKKAEKEAEKKVQDSNIEEKSVSDIVRDADIGSIDIDSDKYDFDDIDRKIEQGEEEITPEYERKKKVNDARDIRNTRNEAKKRAAALVQDKAQLDAIESMIDKAVESASTSDDVLDLETEAFNDLSVLPPTEEELDAINKLNTPDLSEEEINSLEKTIEQLRQSRLDEIKGILEQVKEEMLEGKDEVSDYPKNEKGEEVQESPEDTTGKDPIDKTKEVNKKDDSVEEEEPPTPVTSSYTLSNNQVTLEQESANYWKPNTTEYPIHGGMEPWYESVKDPKRKAFYETVYNFLKDKGVFTRVNNNEVKLGTKVRFAISKELTSKLKKATGTEIPVVLIIDENDNIIGDLVTSIDASIFNRYTGLNKLYEDAVNYSREHVDDNTNDLIIIPNYESKVRRPYVGRPLYTDVDDRKTLNDIAEGKPFKMGIALSDGPTPTLIIEPGKRKKQGLSREELSIIKPVTAKAGQPYLLIETSSPNKKYYPVPITMPLFRENSSQLNSLILSHLSQLQDPEKLLSEEAQKEWKQGLKDLLALGDVYLKVTKAQEGKYNILFRVKQKKTDTAWSTIYNSINDNGMVPLITNSLTNLGISYQISRKYINGQINGRDYNSLIGELAETNLPSGALHTVNDFFSIDPIIDNKTTKAGTIEDKSLKEAENKAESKRANGYVNGTIIPNQDNVDKTKTDKDYYYVKEDDGKYHKYSRVHKVLPVNSNNSNEANSRRALRTGNAVDTIVRDFFNTGKTSKPNFMSETAYNNLVSYLKTLKNWFDEHNWVAYTNNIVLYHKYPDGRRIAGEVDLLMVDDKGHFRIFDIKTSSHPFKGSYFNDIHSSWGQTMSTKDYYTAQLSSYAQLLYDEYGEKTYGLALVPFVVSYDEQNNINSLNHEENIPLTGVKVSELFKRAEIEAEPSTSTPEVDISAAKEKIKKSAKQKFTNKWKQVFDRINDDNIIALSKLAGPILKRRMELIDTLINPSMTDEELNNAISKGLTANREAEKLSKESDLLNKELEVISALLPQLSEEDRVRIVDSLIKIPNGYAWGQFKNGVITIYRKAARGTAYHEAFHYVFNTLLTNEEIKRAYDSMNMSNPVEAEERMAEDFRRYMQNEETFIGRLKNLWSKLRAILNHFNNNWFYMDRLYSDISRSRLANREPNLIESTRNSSNPTVNSLQNIVNTVVNNGVINPNRISKNKAWGKLKDTWREMGYDIRGYYNPNTYGYIVTSVRPIERYRADEINQYHRDKLDYQRLSEEQKSYLEERNIGIKEYNDMTTTEREVLFACMF